VKFCFLPPKVLAIWMALLPLMKPTTCDTDGSSPREKRNT
jgi:hypothetical protein